MSAEDSIGKDRLDKDSRGKCFIPPSVDEIRELLGLPVPEDEKVSQESAPAQATAETVENVKEENGSADA